MEQTLFPGVQEYIYIYIYPSLQAFPAGIGTSTLFVHNSLSISRMYDTAAFLEEYSKV